MINERVNISAWAKRNIWPTSKGELAVRPGLRRIYDAESGRAIVGGFSVRDTATLESVHYIVDVPNTLVGAATLRILNEMWDEVFTIDLETSAIPEVITHAVVMNQVVISSPSFATMWGFIGGPVVVAEPVDSLTTQPSIPIPRGICTTWATSRVAWASGASVFISDPVTVTGGSPQSIIGANQIVLDAPVYGLHEGQGGELIACTSSGVRVLSRAVAAGGQIISGDWSRPSTHQSLSYNDTVVANSRVFGIVKEGIVDVLTGTIIRADDYGVPRYLVPRLTSADFRSHAKLFASRDGPILSSELLSAFAKTDIQSGFVSWWDFSHDDEDAAVIGMMLDTDDKEILLTKNGAYRLVGNFDGEQIIQETGTVVGVIAGRIPTSPDRSPNIRRIDVSSDTFGKVLCATDDGGKFAYIGQKQGRFSGSGEAGGPTWNALDHVVLRSRLKSRRFHWATRHDDVSVEVGAENPQSRIDSVISVGFKGPGKRRPTG